MVIDVDSFEFYKSKKWHVSSTGYAVNRSSNKPRGTIRFHRLVANTPEGLNTDHINHDRLDNRSSNLRVVTPSENMRNLTDQGKGYWFQKQNNNWVVEIHGIHRGTFATEQEADEFARLVRAGVADKKEKVEPTHCQRGHEYAVTGKYMVRGKVWTCKVCALANMRAYYIRKQEKIK